MTMSFNEVEALAKKATRGAGYPWGLAEEAAKAVRWLYARDVDGCAELAGLLAQSDGADLTAWRPVQNGSRWAPKGATLCPIATGAALSDEAEALRDGELRIDQVVHPILLAPFACMSAKHLDMRVTIAWDGTFASTDGEALSIAGAASIPVADVAVTTGGDLDQPRPYCSRAKPAPDGLALLQHLARRTFAPATDESRLKGAGAGLSDND